MPGVARQRVDRGGEERIGDVTPIAPISIVGAPRNPRASGFGR
jgi:hypothetical protein